MPEAFEHANGLRALVYELLSFGQGSLAGRCHWESRNVLTVSPLFGPVEDELHAFEVTTLTEEIEGAFQDGAVKRLRANPEVRLGKRDKMLCLGPPEPQIRRTFEDLWNEPVPERMTFDLEYLTPTATHVTTPRVPRKVDPLPDPSRHYPSWLRQWNQNAPEALRFPKLKSFLEIVDGQVELAGFQGHTAEVLLFDRSTPRARPVVGFVGAARFRVLRPASLTEQDRRFLAAVIRYAEFCGTGVETMRGLGQTRLIAEQ